MEEEEEEEEKEEEKIPLCESIGHRPLRGRCPAPTLHYNLDLPKQGTGTADHLTLLRLFLSFFSFFYFLQILPTGNSRKSVRWSGVPASCLIRLCLKLKREQGSGHMGSMTYDFTQKGYSLSPPSPPSPLPQPPGPYLSLKAHIPASRPISQS